jgi:hypothetical protein
MSSIFLLFNHFAVICHPQGSFFGLPTWYKYLEGQVVTDSALNITSCVPQVNSIDSVLLIGAAIIELLLRVAIFVSIGFVLVAGVRFMTSEGKPDKIKSSIGTLVNALIGLVVAVAAATIVSYVAGKF